jgi:hypothetical protein
MTLPITRDEAWELVKKYRGKKYGENNNKK